MFKRILVPLDGSELSESALIYAEELAGALNSEVELVYVCEPRESEYRHMHQLYIEKIAQQMRNQIEAYHAREKSLVVKVNGVILDGDPAAELIDYAGKNEISLVVMVSHGRSGIMPWSTGSTATKVIQRIGKPLLLIRTSDPALKIGKGEMFNKILIPLDGSENGEAALPYIKELSNELKSEVTLLQVVETGQYANNVGGLDYVLFPEQYVESMKADAQQYLKKVGGKLTGTKATVRSEVRTGQAAQEIIKFADETKARLVAISTHGRSGVRRWISGSVAYKVLQAGHTPLLLVGAPQG
ncbi:universal stress protein [Chloroflexota bacterium]